MKRKEIEGVVVVTFRSATMASIHTSSDHRPVMLQAERDGEPVLVGLVLLGGSLPERRAPRAVVARADGQTLWAPATAPAAR